MVNPTKKKEPRRSADRASSKQTATHSKVASTQKQVSWFSHLPPYQRHSSLSLGVGFSSSEMQASILALGLKHAHRKTSSDNANTVAMLTAFQRAIAEYTTPLDKRLSRDLDRTLVKPLAQFLIDCRLDSVGMDNAINQLRMIISTLPSELSEAHAKQTIIEQIDAYIQSHILLPMHAVATIAQAKITDGDVILTYAHSDIIELVLKRAHAQFRVIVVDSQPHYEGKKMVLKLAAAGVQCTYVQINALQYMLRDVTKVLLGASAFMSNGTAVGTAGTAVVAMAAHEVNVPVVFCCETYKFSDSVQLDAITTNKLQDPDELVASVATEKSDGKVPPLLSKWRGIAQLKLLNLAYDVTPIEYVSMVVTELGMIPPTSIPAILREYANDRVTSSVCV